MAEEAKKETPAEETTAAQDTSGFAEQTTLDDLVDKATVHVRQKEIKTEEEVTESPKEGEEGKSKEAQTADEKVESTEEVQVPFTEEEVAKHYPQYEEYKKAFENRESWNRTLKQKSQLSKFLDGLSEEQQEILRSRTLPYVYGEEKLPDTPEALVKELVEKVTSGVPDYIIAKDEDDIEVKIPRDEYLKQFNVSKMVSEAVKMAVPDVGVVRKKLIEANQKLKEMEQSTRVLQERSGEIEIERLWNLHPELKPSKVRDDETIPEVLERIMLEDNPEYPLFLKLKALNTFKNENGTTIDGAYNAVYGKSAIVEKLEKEAKEQIKKNQEQATSEIPGQKVTPSEKDKLMDEFGNPVYEKIDQMFK